MELHLVRHGADPEGFRGGWSMLGLSDVGREQAERLAARLVRERWSIDTLITSDLPRACETAAIIGQALDIPVVSSLEWREPNNGPLAGMAHAEAERHYPGLYWSALNDDQAYPGGGESPLQFRDRISRAFQALTQDLQTGRLGPQVMVVAHGGPIKLVYHLVQGVEWSHRARGPFPGAHNTGIHSFRLRHGRWEITRKNDFAHLEGMTQTTPGWRL